MYMADWNTVEAIEAFAADIGKNVYIDVAKWHLYLNDAHLHTLVAERLYPMMEKGSVSQSQAIDVLKAIPVKLGGGQCEVPLSDLVPKTCQTALMDVIEDYQRRI